MPRLKAEEMYSSGVQQFMAKSETETLGLENLDLSSLQFYKPEEREYLKYLDFLQYDSSPLDLDVFIAREPTRFSYHGEEFELKAEKQKAEDDLGEFGWHERYNFFVLKRGKPILVFGCSIEIPDDKERAEDRLLAIKSFVSKDENAKDNFKGLGLECYKRLLDMLDEWAKGGLIFRHQVSRAGGTGLGRESWRKQFEPILTGRNYTRGNGEDEWFKIYS